MLQVKLNNYWQSLQDREQKLLKTVFILLPIFILILYFMGLSDSISRNQQQLDIVKNNFNYVYQKANEFLVFSQVQEEIEVFESLPEFLVHQSSEFNLLAFGLMEEQGSKFLQFNDVSLENIGQFFEKAIIHPELAIESIQLSFNDEFFTVKAYYQ